jgi:hypothetical protein
VPFQMPSWFGPAVAVVGAGVVTTTFSMTALPFAALLVHARKRIAGARSRSHARADAIVVCLTVGFVAGAAFGWIFEPALRLGLGVTTHGVQWIVALVFGAIGVVVPCLPVPEGATSRPVPREERQLRMRSMRCVVETPGRRGTSSTLPPYASTSSRPTTTLPR